MCCILSNKLFPIFGSVDLRRYITDYCVWIQKMKRNRFKELYRKLRQVQISKEQIGWPLEFLEQRARDEYVDLGEGI